MAPLQYAYPVDRLLSAFKFHGDLAAGDALCASLPGAVRRASETVDLLLPIPLHRQRLIERGFNQAWEIARQLAHEFGWPARVDGLVRRRHTQAQSGLDARARLYNVRNAFALAIEVRGLRVALVDDVVTTGATVRECARVLQRAGALRVSVFALARAPLA